jgi:hypothetical protein
MACSGTALLYFAENMGQHLLSSLSICLSRFITAKYTQIVGTAGLQIKDAIFFLNKKQHKELINIEHNFKIYTRNRLNAP